MVSRHSSPHRRAVQVLQRDRGDAAGLCDCLHRRRRARQRGDAGDVVADGGLADLVAVAAGAASERRVDDQVDGRLTDQVDHVGRALGDLAHRLDGDPDPLQRAGGAVGGDQLEAERLQQCRQHRRRRLVGVAYRQEHAALARQRPAGGALGLGEGGRKVGPDPHHLSGRAHLRPERRIGAEEALEGQHRRLHADVLGGLLGEIDRQLQRCPAGRLDQIAAGGLGHERHRPRRPRVGLDLQDLRALHRVLRCSTRCRARRSRDRPTSRHADVLAKATGRSGGAACRQLGILSRSHRGGPRGTISVKAAVVCLGASSHRSARWRRCARPEKWWDQPQLARGLRQEGQARSAPGARVLCRYATPTSQQRRCWRHCCSRSARLVAADRALQRIGVDRCAAGSPT